MAARRYFVSPSGHVMFYYYINTNEIPKHFTEKFFCCERRDLLCSHSNGDLFTCENNVIFTCEDLMFSRESSPGISLVFVY